MSVIIQVIRVLISFSIRAWRWVPLNSNYKDMDELSVIQHYKFQLIQRLNITWGRPRIATSWKDIYRFRLCNSTEYKMRCMKLKRHAVNHHDKIILLDYAISSYCARFLFSLSTCAICTMLRSSSCRKECSKASTQYRSPTSNLETSSKCYRVTSRWILFKTFCLEWCFLFFRCRSNVTWQ